MSEFPRYTGESLIIGRGVPTPGDYQAVKEAIGSIQASSTRRYYVVVVQSTGPGQFATRDYAEDLFASWTRSVKNQEAAAFDPEMSILIVVALENRQISVRPGVVIQDRFDLNPDTINRRIVEPGFIPLARAGRIPDAVIRLVRDIDNWIDGREKSALEQIARSEQQQKQLRQDAQDSLASSQAVLDEATRELAEKKSAGLPVDNLTMRIDQARAQIDAAQKLAQTEPQNALASAQRAQESLQQTVEQLRLLASQAAEASAQLEPLADRLRQVDEALDEARRKDLPVTAPRLQLEKVSDMLDQARASLPGQPARSLELLSSVARQLDDLAGLARQLPDLQKRHQQLSAGVAPLLQQTQSALTTADKAGAGISSITGRFEKASSDLAVALSNKPDDLRQAISTLEAAPGVLQSVREDAAKALSRHRFQTRTLPLIIAAIVAILAALVVGFIRLIHVQKRKSVDGRIDEFRTRATQLMERLDTLKERHKLLPLTDPDFKQPMAGQTLSLYQKVDTDVRSLWDRWLSIMDTLEKAQSLIGDSSALGTAKLQEAEQILSDDSLFQTLQEQEKACEAGIERLASAHESATAVLNSAAKTDGRLGDHLQKLSAASLPVEALHQERQKVQHQVDEARSLLLADPIATQESAAHTLELMETLDRRAAEVLSLEELSQQTRAKLDGTRKLVGQEREKGLKLNEPDYEPDRLLDLAQQNLDRSRQHLREGDSSTASQVIEKASQLNDQTHQIVEKTLSAREVVEKELPGCREGLTALEASLPQAATTLDELNRHFAPASWKPVASNLEEARGLVQPLSERIARIAELTSPETQHYLLAAKLLDQAREDQKRASSLITALQQRLKDLGAVREECRDIQAELSNTAREVSQVFQENGRVLSHQARRALEVAQNTLQQAEGGMALSEPDWPTIRQQLASAQETFQIAREQAQTDAQQYQALSNQHEQARNLAQRVGSLLAAEQKDRPAANTRFQAATQSLVSVAEELQNPSGNWKNLSESLQQVIGDLNRAEQLAREDVRLANRAMAGITEAKQAIQEASRALRRARAYSSFGTSADLQNAESLLNQAEASLAAQHYEDAIARAGEARAAAQAAYDKAAREASEREWRIEAEKRRREAVQRAQHSDPMAGLGPFIAGAALEILRSGVAGAAQGRPAASPLPSQGGGQASSSSWGSGTSQANW